MDNTRVETNESQINMKIIKNIIKGFSDIIKGIQQINDPLNELASAQQAKVFYGSSCCGSGSSCKCKCDCKCECTSDYCCPDIKILYNTSIKTGNVEKYFFKNLANLALCGLGADCKLKKISDITLSSPNEYALRGTVFSEAIKTSGCSFCRCCELQLDVFISNENRLAGVVKFRGPCDDYCGCTDCCKTECLSCYKYFYCCEILDHNRNNVYNIFIRQCCLSVCPVDCCGNIDFAIKDSSRDTVGEIKCNKDCCPCCEFKCIYDITFPPNSTPENKLTIINAVIAIDLFYLKTK